MEVGPGAVRLRDMNAGQESAVVEEAQVTVAVGEGTAVAGLDGRQGRGELVDGSRSKVDALDASVVRRDRGSSP